MFVQSLLTVLTMVHGHLLLKPSNHKETFNATKTKAAASLKISEFQITKKILFDSCKTQEPGYADHKMLTELMEYQQPGYDSHYDQANMMNYDYYNKWNANYSNTATPQVSGNDQSNSSQSTTAQQSSGTPTKLGDQSQVVGTYQADSALCSGSWPYYHHQAYYSNYDNQNQQYCGQAPSNQLQQPSPQTAQGSYNQSRQYLQRPNQQPITSTPQPTSQSQPGNTSVNSADVVPAGTDASSHPYGTWTSFQDATASSSEKNHATKSQQPKFQGMSNQKQYKPNETFSTQTDEYGEQHGMTKNPSDNSNMKPSNSVSDLSTLNTTTQSGTGSSYPVIRFNLNDPTRRQNIKPQQSTGISQWRPIGRGRGGLGQNRPARWSDVDSYSVNVFQQGPQQLQTTQQTQDQTSPYMLNQNQTVGASTYLTSCPQRAFTQSHTQSIDHSNHYSYQNQVQQPPQHQPQHQPPHQPQHQPQPLSHQQQNQTPQYQQHLDVSQQQYYRHLSQSYSNSSRPSVGDDKSKSANDAYPRTDQTSSKSAISDRDCWPEPLKAYVRDAFMTCKSPSDKDRMEQLLKSKLSYVFSKNIVNEIDWSKEQYPTLISDSSGRRGVMETDNYIRSRRSPQSIPRRIPKGGRNVFTRRPSSSSSSSKSQTRSRSRSPPRSTRRQRKRRRRNSSSSDSSVGRSSTPGSSRRSPRNNRSQRDNRDQRDQPRSSRMSGRMNHDTNDDNRDIPQSGSGRGGKKGNRIRGGHNNTVFQHHSTKEQLARRANRFRDHLREGGKREDENNLSNVRQWNGSLTDSISNMRVGGQDVEFDGELDWTGCKIVGTCEALEKEYLRLTRAPDASEVRPVSVLEKSLELVTKKWYNKEADYLYICEQFKSIRQDLTVQCIRNSLTVKVYETHALVSLEAADHEEFNQCQSQLKVLYEEGVEGSIKEFLAYRLLYYMFTKDFLNMNTIMASLTPSIRSHPCVKFALEIRSAWSLNNYHRFFLLYKNAPNHCGKIVRWFLERERLAAVRVMIKAYRPVLPVSFIQEELGFEDGETQPTGDERMKTAEEECHDFLQNKARAYVFSDETRTKLDCRQIQL